MSITKPTGTLPNPLGCKTGYTMGNAQDPEGYYAALAEP
jgi:hypothetical protein